MCQHSNLKICHHYYMNENIINIFKSLEFQVKWKQISATPLIENRRGLRTRESCLCLFRLRKPTVLRFQLRFEKPEHILDESLILARFASNGYRPPHIPGSKHRANTAIGERLACIQVKKASLIVYIGNGCVVGFLRVWNLTQWEIRTKRVIRLLK